MSDTNIDEPLAHYGVPGMRWGFRRDKNGVYRRSGNRVKEYSDDAAIVRDLKVRKATKGVQSLSNKEIQTVITRIDLEKRLNTLSPTASSKGRAQAEKMLNQFGDKTGKALATAAAAAVSAAVITTVKKDKGGDK